MKRSYIFLLIALPLIVILFFTIVFVIYPPKSHDKVAIKEHKSECKNMTVPEGRISVCKTAIGGGQGVFVYIAPGGYDHVVDSLITTF